MNKILTISIASYNAEKDIPRCLDSFIQTTVFDKLDIIVVNDGSSDNTSQVASEYAKKYPNSIRVVDKENGGHGSTINTGITYAKGKYFKIVDSDDWVNKDGLEDLVSYLENNDIDLVINPFHTINYSDHKILQSFDDKPNSFNYKKVYSVNQLNGSEELHMHAMTFKTEIMKNVGPVIDEHCFYVDMEYCIYPLAYITNYVYLENTVYEYLLGSQTQSVSISSFIKRRNEHKKVVKSLIEYYKNNCKGISDKIDRIIVRRINQAIYTQLAVYLQMKSKTGKKELLEFVDFVRNFNFKIDNKFSSKLKRLFWKLFEFTNYQMYGLFSFIYRKIKN